MKIGVISDIHGNIKALNIVLDELKKRNVNKIICLGDMVGIGSASKDVVQSIIELQNEFVIVRGNHEKYLIEGMPKIIHDEGVKTSQKQIDRNILIAESLNDLQKKFIYNLPKEIIYNVEGKKIYIVHYPMNKDGSFKKHIKEASIEENESMFSDIDADIYLYGHTHRQIYNTRNNKIFINPGSLGCPENTGCAPYGILTIDKNGVKYEQLHAEYNVQEVIDSIIATGLPGYKEILELFYGANADKLI